ncbi:argininosuccinate lyase [Vreelandella titanicae]|uniref:argininosuccinate lyase n=1 Tax=Vreelandella titanicae TaxID=664683 RepID=UPI003FD8BD6E
MKIWAGRLSKEINDKVLNYTETTNADLRLIKYDILGSIAHVKMLHKQKIITENCEKNLLSALIEIYRLNENGLFTLEKEYEDVHLNIENKINCIIGDELGGMLHTARSRNDQVVNDTRLYLRSYILEIKKSLEEFSDNLLLKSTENINSLAVGYTHVQPAQPISLAFWYTAYVSIFNRDITRLENTFNSTNCSVLGSCALSGTSFNIDRSYTQELLGFENIISHALDATSSRDFIIECLSTLSIIMSNLSRLAEEIITWNSFEYGTLNLDDSFTTGSSIMPQKKNPVVAELAKGKVSRVYGALMQSLAMVKGVGLGYNCDLQEDKPLLWDALDTTIQTIKILDEHIKTSSYDSQRAYDICWGSFSTITELANWLVTNKGLPFRKSHLIAGQLTNFLISKKATLKNSNIALDFLKSKDIELSEEEYFEILDPKNVMNRQVSRGSTSPTSVKIIIEELEESLLAHKDFTFRKSLVIEKAESSLLKIKRG